MPIAHRSLSPSSAGRGRPGLHAERLDDRLFQPGIDVESPSRLTKADSGGWTLWEKLVQGRSDFGNPAAFNSCIAQSRWDSFAVTLKTPALFDHMRRFSGNEAGTGGLVTFKDSNWLMSIVLANQPHFAN